MAQQTFKCPECGGRTRAGNLFRRLLPLTCEKCLKKHRDLHLAEQNRARLAELDRRWRQECPPLYRATDPNHEAIDQHVLGNIMEWDPHTAGGKGIAFIGPTGGCKTRMMLLLLRKLHYLGITVRFIPAIELSRASSKMFDEDSAIKNEARRVLKHAVLAEVLFIDDLGKERFTDRTEIELHYLIETRISFLRPILWTSNASCGADLRELMSENRGPAITRRLAEFSTVHFVRPLYERAKSIEQIGTKVSARPGAV